MRRAPNLPKFHAAIERLLDLEERLARVTKAGPIHEWDGFTFHRVDVEPADAAVLWRRVLDSGGVPESLRLTRLTGATLATGEGSNRAQLLVGHK